MNKAQALSILDLPQDANEDQIKKKFRELSKKYHPDVCKEPGAEEKFKEINSAFSYLKDPPPQSGFNSSGSVNVDLNDIFSSFFRSQNPFGQQRPVDARPIRVVTNLTFEESIKGCKKVMTITRSECCANCRGQGGTPNPASKCSYCQGQGFVVQNHGNMQVRHVCAGCSGTGGERLVCSNCTGKGSQSFTRDLEIHVPEGVYSGVTLQVPGQGNFFVMMGQPQQSDLLVDVTVEPSDMKLEGNDVTSRIDVSLADCLAGKTLNGKTVWGDVEIAVPQLSRHSDIVEIKSHGVKSKNGSHKFMINTIYPDNVEELLTVLRK